MQDLEAKRLRESLVEYENYLNEIRQVTRKNVDALDVIQKYTDQSAAGMQRLRVRFPFSFFFIPG